ncbi:MAG: porin [Melioribacteraceae bacterium]
MQYKLLLFFIFLFIGSIIAQNDDFIEPKTTVGGYGELHFNHENNIKNDVKQTLDFHRFVLFFSHNWNEKWSFKSEVELEHNFVQDGQGELELEQAYINYHYSDWIGFQFGVVLPSIGLINENHEPVLFMGVERPEYHNKIIPTTWFGNGMAIYGKLKGFEYKLTIMEGLNNEKFSHSSGIRSGRKKGFMANAENLLYNLRLDYIDIPGIILGASYSYNKASGDTSSNKIDLLEFHASYKNNNILAIFEYGQINYEKYSLKKSNGFYFDLGYDFADLLNIETRIILFIRYTDYNTASSTTLGGNSEQKYHYNYFMFGVSIKPLDNVVFKADYGSRINEIETENSKLFNLGVGYYF